MAKPETLKKVIGIFELGEKVNGCTDLGWIAEQVEKATGYSDQEAVVRGGLRMKTNRYLFPNTKATLGALVEKGDDVVIWTQGHEWGQLYKVANSGVGRLRRGLPHEDRSRFSVYVHREKVADLANPINRLIDRGVSQIVLIDDKAENVVEVAEKVDELKSKSEVPGDFKVNIIWTRQGKYKDRVPKGETVESFSAKFRTIHDISELVKLGGELPGRTGWLVDWDNTSFATAEYNKEFCARIAHRVDGIEEIFPSGVGVRTGLTGNVEEAVEISKGGMSGASISKIHTTDDRYLVVKHNSRVPQRVRNDIDGYTFLSGTPLRDKMPVPVKTDHIEGVLVLPHYPGYQLRESLLKGDLPETVAMRVSKELLDLKIAWWGGQDKMKTGNYKSMQRSEWEETEKLIPKVVEKLSSRFGISKNAVMGMEICLGGVRLPSLNYIIDQVREQLWVPPPYVIGVHGDATGANIIVDSSLKSWKLLDAEWAGMGDPAESFVRMAKQKSTTTASSFEIKGIDPNEGVLRLGIDSQFHPSARMLHNYVLKRTGEFADALEDKDFAERVRKYLAGSYLRELALITQRGTIDKGLLAIVLAGEALSGLMLPNAA